ncbi:MAG: hypothetical protein COT85_02550 [Chlamydiae bacterium CG10_big_fil_rev_8_21_14_0_10_42_34]|nr:MAG: hypothetical protein COT85_02550 [Chlamydiae bacterium CG10_big_fil_rev_8_21_14_0_10_42_34]
MASGINSSPYIRKTAENNGIIINDTIFAELDKIQQLADQFFDKIEKRLVEFDDRITESELDLGNFKWYYSDSKDRLEKVKEGNLGYPDFDLERCSSFLAAKRLYLTKNKSSLRIRPANSPFPTTITLLEDEKIFLNIKKSLFAVGGYKKAKKAIRLKDCSVCARLTSTRVKSCANEFYNHRQLNRIKGVVRLIGATQYSDKKKSEIPKFEIFQKLYTGDLKSVEEELNAHQKRELAKKLIKNLARIEKIGIHRDIKLENILVDEEMNPYFGDFGTFEFRGSISDKQVGTRNYFPPEYYHPDQNNYKKHDVWSMGITLLRLFSKKKPLWANLPTEQQIDIVNNLNADWMIEYDLLDAKYLAPIIIEMLRLDPNSRITANNAAQEIEPERQTYRDNQQTLAGYLEKLEFKSCSDEERCSCAKQLATIAMIAQRSSRPIMFKSPIFPEGLSFVFKKNGPPIVRKDPN